VHINILDSRLTNHIAVGGAAADCCSTLPVNMAIGILLVMVVFGTIPLREYCQLYARRTRTS